MAEFVKDPLIDHEQMAVEHITTLMALLLPDPFHARAVNLLCQTYAPDVAEYIWSQWGANIQLPPTHPWSTDTKARDNILDMLQMAYTDPDIVARDIKALTNIMAAAIPTEIFIL